LQYWRWLRQSFVVPNAELLIFQYPEAYSSSGRAIVRTQADKNGWFDFGVLPAGRYTLIVRSSSRRDWFDVEINPAVPKTKQVLVDVSSNFPDCRGGHEFLVTSFWAVFEGARLQPRRKGMGLYLAQTF
jgi:hypothetical protein